MSLASSRTRAPVICGQELQAKEHVAFLIRNLQAVWRPRREDTHTVAQRLSEISGSLRPRARIVR